MVAGLAGWFVFINWPRPTDGQVKQQFSALAPATSLVDCEAWLDSHRVKYDFTAVNKSATDSGHGDVDPLCTEWFDHQKTYKWNELGGILTASVPDTGTRIIGCDPGAQQVYLFFDKHKRLLCDHVVWLDGGCI